MEEECGVVVAAKCAHRRALDDSIGQSNLFVCLASSDIRKPKRDGGRVRRGGHVIVGSNIRVSDRLRWRIVEGGWVGHGGSDGN